MFVLWALRKVGHWVCPKKQLGISFAVQSICDGKVLGLPEVLDESLIGWMISVRHIEFFSGCIFLRQSVMYDYLLYLSHFLWFLVIFFYKHINFHR